MTRKGGRPAKLSHLQYCEVMAHRLLGARHKDIARRYGVARSTISRYLRGECRQYEDARNH